MVILDISDNRTSSVTVPTLTMIFESRSGAEEVSLIIFDREMGARLVFDRKSRWRRTWCYRSGIRFAPTGPVLDVPC